jgi:hypothetical protein
MCMAESDSSGFPYPLSIVHGAQAEAELKRLMRSGKHEGFSPVIIGNKGELDRVTENMEFNESSVDEILARAEKISAEEWFRTKQAEFEDDEQTEEEETDKPSSPDSLTVRSPS